MDEALIVRARLGDVDAFSALAASRLPRLYRVAGLIVRDADAAADVVQEALLAAWRDLPSLREVASFDAWLRRLLVRACQRAAAKRRTSSVIEIPIPLALTDATSDHQRTLAIRDQLDRGFRRLTDDQRAVVVLRHYLGLSLVETADAIGVPVGTVQSRLSRAMQALRAALEADDRTPFLIREATR